MLRSLEVKNFRTFHHLHIERLGRVNLIVGKNNVGKTTLLEALRLYGSIWPLSTVASILRDRNEVARSSEGKALLLLDSLFHGRSPEAAGAIIIRQLNADGNDPGFRATAEAPQEIQATPDPSYPPSGRLSLDIKSAGRRFTLLDDGSGSYSIPSRSPKPPEFPPDPPYLRGVGIREGMEDTIADWWDAISLTESEHRVLETLQIISPIKEASFVGDPRRDAGRMAKVRVDGIAEPVALATLGDGVVRVFQIAVALEYAAIRSRRTLEAEPDLSKVFPLLLIDEVESGIHHTLHVDLWQFILKAARELDVQVVATTHSHDCLMGFAQALADEEQADGQVVRLERSEGEEATRAVVISREKLPIVARDAIEVR